MITQVYQDLDFISNTINLIADASNQTNLLALNAIIKTARVGEYSYKAIVNMIKDITGKPSDC